MNKYKNHHRKPRAYRPVPPFAIVEGSGTAPFKRLGPYAVWVLLRFYDKFTGFNRNSLSLTYLEVSKVMSSRVYSRALWQLIGFGFIDTIRWGGLMRTCTIFALSNRWRRYDQPDNPALEDTLNQIQETLNEIETLKREKWPDELKQEKRERIRALRSLLLKR